MILHETRGPEDWKAHLAQPDLHWKPGRSAMEAARSWEAARPGLPTDIAALFPGADLVQAVVEYPVPLPGGRADSMTDVFALLREGDRLVVCMVEAKRDESFDRTLAEWLEGASPGKRERLAALCGWLGLDESGLSGSLRYQLLQRAGAAVATARRYATTEAALVVQSFSPVGRWREDFDAFVRALGLDPVAGTGVSRTCPGGIRLRLGWAAAPFATGAVA